MIDNANTRAEADAIREFERDNPDADNGASDDLASDAAQVLTDAETAKATAKVNGADSIGAMRDRKAAILATLSSIAKDAPQRAALLSEGRELNLQIQRAERAAKASATPRTRAKGSTDASATRKLTDANAAILAADPTTDFRFGGVKAKVGENLDGSIDRRIGARVEDTLSVSGMPDFRWPAVAAFVYGSPAEAMKWLTAQRKADARGFTPLKAKDIASAMVETRHKAGTKHACNLAEAKAYINAKGLQAVAKGYSTAKGW